MSVDCPTPMGYGDRDVDTFLAAADQLHAANPLIDITWKEVAGVPGQYIYKWRTVNGKTWKQTITISTGLTSMNFNQTAGEWELREFEPHRAVRDVLVQMCRTRIVTDLIYKRIT